VLLWRRKIELEDRAEMGFRNDATSVLLVIACYLCARSTYAMAYQ
jgi:hypothetical protein